MLALRGARDWRRMENIRLQSLEDHHIFPRRYLKDHGIHKRLLRNSIVNRTLISDETNGKIRDHAPADYIREKTIFPSGPSESLMEPHFLSENAIALMRKASEKLAESELAVVYEQFSKAREAAIVTEIRRISLK